MDKTREHKKKLEKSRFKISDSQAKAQIGLIIRAWLKSNQEVAKSWAIDIDNVRQTRVNKTASSKDSGIRFGANLPFGLLKEIEKQFPDLFRDKSQFRWFIKTFKMFTIPRKI